VFLPAPFFFPTHASLIFSLHRIAQQVQDLPTRADEMAALRNVVFEVNKVRSHAGSQSSYLFPLSP
jgi:hypothetical protein